MLGVEHPIMLAGMGGVSYAEVTAAVSNAGGFGTLGMAGTSAKFIESQMKRVRELTDKPFGVDLLSAQPESLTAAIDVIIANGARAFVAGLGIPYPIVRQLKDNSVLVIAVIGKVDHAIKAEQAGCDAVIAQGTEGGGHTGQVAPVALWPQVVDAVKIPVVAAGGLYDGRGLAAALAMGCVGVWMGTRFIASTEAHAGGPYKDAILGMTESDTTISRGFTGKTLRALKNRTTDRFEKGARQALSAAGDGIRPGKPPRSHCRRGRQPRSRNHVFCGRSGRRRRPRGALLRPDREPHARRSARNARPDRKARRLIRQFHQSPRRRCQHVAQIIPALQRLPGLAQKAVLPLPIAKCGLLHQPEFRPLRRPPEGRKGRTFPRKADRIVAPFAGRDHPAIELHDAVKLRTLENGLPGNPGEGNYRQAASPPDLRASAS